MDKWHYYLYGKHDITVHSDHQPLETIFKKPLSRAPRRLQRMMLKLQKYQFKKGKELFIADTLSRLTTSVHDYTTPTVIQECKVFRVELAQMDLAANRVTVETMNQIREETSKDSVLAVLHWVVLSGWPSERKEVPDQIRVYWDSRDEITVYYRIFTSLIKLSYPHPSNLKCYGRYTKLTNSADSSIRRARKSVYWPGMQAAIRQTCSSSGVCAQYLSERPREPMGSHDIPFRPWSKVSADLFQLNGSNYLVLVDHYSGYFELEPLQNSHTSHEKKFGPIRNSRGMYNW